MTMPRNLVLVRHGFSEANFIQKSAKNGDNSHYTEDVVTVPDRNWRLAEEGTKQAPTAGAYVNALFTEGFDRYMVSPYTRTRETAALLGLEGADWEENRALRERSWGEIDSMSREEFNSRYPQNAIYKAKDPLYWRPPAGESIASVSEDRVRNVLSTLHRENSDQNVVAVSHGEFMWATRLVLERWSDEDFIEKDHDPNEKIHNCTVLQYTRVNPFVEGDVAPKLSWVRRAWPIQLEDESWTMEETPWEEFHRSSYSNEELLARAHVVENWDFKI